VHGGGTLQSLGAAPLRYDVAIVTRALGAVAEYEPRDLTIGVEAGITLAQLDHALAAHGQFLPIDAPRRAQATLGGTLAAGWLGPRRGTYGRPRDLVIGTVAALADGTLTHAGGMVVKNVTGYDVGKLFIGSLGTLGTLVRVNLKTLPVPPVMRVALAPLPEETRLRAFEHLAQMEVEPSAALWIGGYDGALDGASGPDGRLVLVLEGTPGVVDRATRELRSVLGAAGVPQTQIVDQHAAVVYQRVLDATVATVERRSATLRIGGPPGTIADRLRTVEEVARMAAVAVDCIADLRNGDAFARLVAAERGLLDSEFALIVSTLRERLANVTTVAGATGDADPWGPAPATLPAMRELKARFDPNGTLAPGRYVAGI
jgi:glycolate oxidase FAD binding subunit